MTKAGNKTVSGALGGSAGDMILSAADLKVPIIAVNVNKSLKEKRLWFQEKNEVRKASCTHF